MQLDSVEVTIGLLMAFFTLWFSWFQYRRTQRQRTSELYSEFYAADHYRRVVMPVYRLIRKLDALDRDTREEYLAAIVAGWDRSPDSQALYRAFVSEEERGMTPMEQHFQVESSTEAHSEHEALTSFLYFWVRTHRMLKAGLLDEKLLVTLFCNSFAYYHGFLELIRDRVAKTFDSEDATISRQRPGWIEATRHMEKLLEPTS